MGWNRIIGLFGTGTMTGHPSAHGPPSGADGYIGVGGTSGRIGPRTRFGPHHPLDPAWAASLKITSNPKASMPTSSNRFMNILSDGDNLGIDKNPAECSGRAVSARNAHGLYEAPGIRDHSACARTL
jgi:hypothetical protein